MDRTGHSRASHTQRILLSWTTGHGWLWHQTWLELAIHWWQGKCFSVAPLQSLSEQAKQSRWSVQWMVQHSPILIAVFCCIKLKKSFTVLIKVIVPFSGCDFIWKLSILRAKETKTKKLFGGFIVSLYFTGILTVEKVMQEKKCLIENAKKYYLQLTYNTAVLFLRISNLCAKLFIESYPT